MTFGATICVLAHSGRDDLLVRVDRAEWTHPSEITDAPLDGFATVSISSAFLGVVHVIVITQAAARVVPSAHTAFVDLGDSIGHVEAVKARGSIAATDAAQIKDQSAIRCASTVEARVVASAHSAFVDCGVSVEDSIAIRT